MEFIDLLREHHRAFTQLLTEHNSSDLLVLPYAEYSNQIYLQFHPFLRSRYLAENSPLSSAMMQAGIIEQDEQLILFILTHYLSLHIHDPIEQAKNGRDLRPS